jgi:hypothetical protein
MEQLRDKLTAEKEEALATEKEFLKQRIEKQAECEELEYQAQRHRFLAEIRKRERKTRRRRGKNESRIGGDYNSVFYNTMNRVDVPSWLTSLHPLFQGPMKIEVKPSGQAELQCPKYRLETSKITSILEFQHLGKNVICLNIINK